MGYEIKWLFVKYILNENESLSLCFFINDLEEIEIKVLFFVENFG